MISIIPFLFIGCDAINKAKETIDGILDPIVVEGIVLGVDTPHNAQLQAMLEGSDFKGGTSVTLFAADARDVQDIENAPITGATVTLSGPGVDVQVDELESGTYSLVSDQNPVVYTPGDRWKVQLVREVKDGTAVSTAEFTLPNAVDFSGVIPEQHQQDTAIDLDFSGKGFDSALVVVVDSNGEVTYSNEPNGIQEFYEFTHGEGELGALSVPGTAFPDEGVYAVGVAGLKNTDAAELDQMNTALSSIIYGQMVFYPVSTMVVPAN